MAATQCRIGGGGRGAEVPWARGSRRDLMTTPPPCHPAATPRHARGGEGEGGRSPRRERASEIQASTTTAISPHLRTGLIRSICQPPHRPHPARPVGFLHHHAALEEERRGEGPRVGRGPPPLHQREEGKGRGGTRDAWMASGMDR